MSTDWHMLVEEERLFADMLSRVVADQIAPRAKNTDETGVFVGDQLAVLAEMGMLGANLPEVYGGGALSAPALLRAIEIVAGGCGSTVSALTAHYLATDSVLLGGTEAQKAAILPLAAAGEWLGAFALTEPGAGSDPGDMKTRAVRDRDGWRLTGSKCFISNGGVADFLVVYAITDPDAGRRGVSAFVVMKDTPGFTAGPAEATMGLKGGHVFSLSFDCALSSNALLGGAPGAGFRTAMQVLDNGRVDVAAQCLGLAGAALSAATEYVKDRIVGGKPLADRQGLQWMLADAATELTAARLMAQEAARQRDAGGRFSEIAAMAKLKASEVADR
ncbi:MAG: acyl-CoA dehydrogenase family protein, partial [Pikeienuella sp.]